MVKVILRSLVFHNPTQVQLIRGDPRYKLMSPEEVIGKFVSFELMIKGSKQIVQQGGTSTPEVQLVAFKATEEKKEESTSSRLPIDASKLDNEEMALIIKSFRQILKQRKGKDYKPHSKRVCATSVVSPVILSLNALCLVIVTGTMTRRRGRRKRKSTTRRRAAMPTCVGNGLRHELHRLLLRRGCRKHRRKQGTSLPQRRPQLLHGKGWQEKEGTS
jgi:hypothetical protein